MLIRMVRSADLWLGLALMLIGVICIHDGVTMFVPIIWADKIGPRMFPILLGSVLVLLAGIVWIRAALLGSQVADIGRPGTLGVLIGSCIAYVLLFGPLGYVLSTALLLAFLFVYLGERRHWLTAVVTVGVTMAFYFLFVDFLDVRLPVGPLGF